jgi:hypothetical protein
VNSARLGLLLLLAVVSASLPPLMATTTVMMTMTLAMTRRCIAQTGEKTKWCITLSRCENRPSEEPPSVTLQA